MKKAFFLFASLLLIVSCAQQPFWFSGSFDEAKQLAQTENKLILVDYYSDG